MQSLTMAPPFPQGNDQKALSAGEKKKATMILWGVVFAIDIVVIAAYFWLVLVPGWDPTLTLVPLLGVSMITGLFFAWQKRKIDRET